MTFMLYRKQNGNLIQTREYFSLAGYNLIYNIWEKRARPTDQGWQISANDLIKEHSGGKHNNTTHALLIDFHPSARIRIGIIELLDIYAYTYSGATKNDAGWTPMMLRLRDVLYEEYETKITDQEKGKKIKNLKEPDDKEDFVEFLYINGPDKGWNWGRNGMTNAAFMHGPAREYFRIYF